MGILDEMMKWRTVKSTREGLRGKTTAAGLTIDEHSAFVALPSRKALWKIVAIRWMNKTLLAPILDVGPWNVADDKYVFGDARPLSEEGVSLSGHGTNGSGIDLSDGLIAKFGMHAENWNNYTVEWSFISGEDLRDV